MAGFLVININIAQIEALAQGFDPSKVKESFRYYEEKLADDTLNHVREQAEQKLDPELAPKYIAGLKKVSSEAGFSIVNSKETEWIETGIKPGFNMLPGILKGKDKVVVPFVYNKGKKSPLKSKLMSIVRKELKARKISETKLERDSKGAPLINKSLHKFSINEPVSKKDAYGLVPKTQRKPWMNEPIKDTHSGPMLLNVYVFQREVAGKNPKRPKTERGVIAFRTAVASHNGQKWIHPGMKGAEIMTEGQKWVDEHWEQDLFPKLIEHLIQTE